MTAGFRKTTATLLALCVVGCSPAASKVQTANLYERAEVLAKDPAFNAKMAKSVAKLDEMRWLVGEWRAEITVFRTARSPETHSEEIATFRQHGNAVIADDSLSTIIGFDPFVDRWLSTGVELPAGGGSTAYGDWDGRRMVLDVDARIFGETYRLRQTLTRTGPDSFEVFNQQLQAGGRYVPVDRYRYRRIRN